MTTQVLNYTEKGQGTPLVILHGLFGAGDNWGAIANALKDHYRVILIDQRNHGRSFHADEMSYPIMAQDLLNLVNKLDLKEFILMGHSMGGKTAMEFALHHGEHVSKLIIVDIAPRNYEHHHSQIFETLNLLDMNGLANRKEAESFMTQIKDGRGIEDPSIRQFLLKSFYKKEDGEFAWRFNLKVLEKCYDNISKAPSLGKPFNNKTLFIKGANSNYIQTQDQKLIAPLFPNAEAKIISGAGHWPHAEKTQLFLSVLNKFLV